MPEFIAVGDPLGSKNTMFVNFFYQLKAYRIPISITEWMLFVEALSKGMAHSSLIGFYYLARAVLVKSEAYYDRFDLAFYSYFRGVETPIELMESVLQWLENALPALKLPLEERHLFEEWDIDGLRQQLEDRLREQKEEHHGGNKWIGTGGTSPFGHSGQHPAGVRIGGESLNRSAVQVAAQRNFRGYRSDVIIGVRQFEIVLRKLRHLSSKVEGPLDELDLEETINKTGDKGGLLSLVWARSRKNTVKVALLMDSGGSMDPYSRLCSQLFTAMNRTGHFKELRFFYFHNCIYQHLYNEPSCYLRDSVRTEDLLRMLGPECKIILLGDASMAPSELTMPGGAIDYSYRNQESGTTWLLRLANHFSHTVWLNPIPAVFWERGLGNYTIQIIREIFPMYELSIDGLDCAIKKLKGPK